MALEFLNDTPVRAFRKLEGDLALVNPELNLRRFKSMTPRSLGEEISRLDGVRQRMVSESTYGSWLRDEKYVETRLLQEALTRLREYKEGVKESEVLVPGFTYYRKVKQFGKFIEGQRYVHAESSEPLWGEFRMPIAIAKAFEVMCHGSEDDFRSIYVEMADGRLNALEKVSVEHLTESSEDALSAIEEYCDQRWNGPWAWETPSPYSLRESIEERNEMNLQTVNEMQAQFDSLIKRLNEEEMDKYAAIASAEEMADTIQKMVEQIARLAGEGIIKLKDQLRVTMGDDAAAQIEDTFLDPVRQAADALSQLRATIMQTVDSLKGVDAATDVAGAAALDTAADAGAAAGADAALGTPGDALAGDADALAGDMADVSIDGEEGERPMKDM